MGDVEEAPVETGEDEEAPVDEEAPEVGTNDGEEEGEIGGEAGSVRGSQKEPTSEAEVSLELFSRSLLLLPAKKNNCKMFENLKNLVYVL